MEKLEISTPFIKLEQALKLAGCVMTGGDAKLRIEEGYAEVNGEICTCRGRKLVPGDQIVLRPALEEERLFACEICEA